MEEVIKFFSYFFLAFFLVAAVIAFFTKKPFLYWLGIMLMLATIVLLVWSSVIDDGSRRHMEALVLLIMYSVAAGSFLVGFLIYKIGVSQNRKKVMAGESVVKTEDSPG